MELKVSGKIVKIGEVISHANGAKELLYRIDTGEQYNNIVEFKMYKTGEYITHVEKFSEFNKVGDAVTVEFKLNTFNWKPESDDKIFTSLTHWRLDKVGTGEVSATAPPLVVQSEEDDLPF